MTRPGDTNELQDESQHDSGSSKGRAYEPPQVTRVTLRPEEAVLGACKSASLAASSPSTGANCIYPLPCPNPGS